MSRSDIPPIAEERTQTFLPRKVFLILLLVIITALGLLFQFKQKSGHSILKWDIFVGTVLGLVSGLSSRFILRKRHGLIRFIVAIAILVVGLLAIGLLTNWEIGLSPLQFWRKTINWIDVIELAVGTVTLFLALRAWPVRMPVAVVEVPVPEPQPQALQLQPRPQTSSRARPRRKIVGPTSVADRPIRNRKPRKKPEVKRPAPIIAGKPSSSSKRQALRRKPLVHVHLSKIERHICPYCLEPVTRNDSRGVVECEICHTLHHGDCWKIAGVCQVPHYNP